MKWYQSHENYDSLKDLQMFATLMWGAGMGGLQHSTVCFAFYSSYSRWENEEIGEMWLFLKNNCIRTAHKLNGLRSMPCSTDNTFSEKFLCETSSTGISPSFSEGKRRKIQITTLCVCDNMWRFSSVSYRKCGDAYQDVGDSKVSVNIMQKTHARDGEIKSTEKTYKKISGTFIKNSHPYKPTQIFRFSPIFP